MMKRKEFLKYLAALSGLSITGCGWKLGNVKAQANITGQRDQLYLFTWTQYTDDKELLKTFTAQTGIKLLADLYESNDIMLAKMLAGGGGAYSVIYPSDYKVQEMIDKGLLSEIQRDRLVGVENLFPQFQNPSYDPNNRYSIPFTWGTTGFIYNSEVLTIPPSDWEYLWKNRDRLNRKMTLLNDTREVFGAVLKMLGYSYNSTNESEIKQAYEKLQELKPSLAGFDTDAWRNKILSGDSLIAMCYSGDAIKIMKEYPKFKYIIPQNGTSLWTDTLVISKTAPNPDGAYAWINYLLQPEVSAQLTINLSLATPNQASFDLLPKKYQTNTSLFPDEEILNKCERISPLGDTDEVYERYWTQLTSA
ncbi:spermidine/putrescine ABC transporter substrate-binding protein [Calothrix sp. UHCC 0171]|uniref:polyamine ABC transporter substrate-binding protein n=1 Tax=Calothrix sp. UHCC 0171 TaxID=3110245 RepID=UPI002B1FD321|nr:spermidine/putrescine ABC transporter substrate-binding protein [Calothrix sp. UHCC 0171]MEA5570631.1 spermidine/putrescine ABC transporter substrate-binding protein [Calothrix sp. UHCC 0171]